MLFSSILAAAVALVGASVTDASPNKINLAREPVARFGSKYMGCYDSINGFKKENTTQFQTESECGIKHCVPLGKPVIAINDQDCYCADKLPSKSHKVDDKKCSQICPGYDKDNCGSADGKHFSMWSDGLLETVESAKSEDEDVTASKSSKAAESKATTPSVVTNFVGGETVIVTHSPEAGKKEEESSGPNKAGIAAGVVVGVVVIAAAIGGIWFFMRARNRRELEDAHRRQAAINAFVKSPNDAPAFDTRLEPAIMRRMSAGSIADNQDYSRRILKVTNA